MSNANRIPASDATQVRCLYCCVPAGYSCETFQGRKGRENTPRLRGPHKVRIDDARKLANEGLVRSGAGWVKAVSL